MNFTKMTANEIRQKIYDEFGIDPTKIKGKYNLVSYYNMLISGEPGIMSKDFELIDEPAFSKDIETINKYHKNWTKYILDQLEEDEFESDKNDNTKKYPRCDGLRRVLEKNISPIVCIKTKVVQEPNPHNHMTATVRSCITLENGELYEAVADAQASNLPSPYDKHVTAIAETRAEGRVYRKALRLKNIVTKEEIDTDSVNKSGSINDTQIKFINIMCSNDKLNINAIKFLNLLFPKITDITQLSYDNGTKIGQTLSEYQKNPEIIPTDIRGYVPGWRD